MQIFKAKYSFLSFLPPFKGKLRLSRMIYTKRESLSQPYVLSMKGNIKLAVTNLIDSIGYELFINGTYERNLVNYLIENIPENGVFIDVGANIGAITIPVAFHRPDIKVFSIEASPFVFEYLKYNVDIHSLQNITLINKAIHITDGEILDFYTPKDQFGKGSFSNVFTDESEKVQTSRMDTLIKEHSIKPNIIKVDVEGYESFVFQSMSNYLLESGVKPIIIFEFVDWCEKLALGEEYIGDAQNHLINIGYTLYDFDSKETQPIKKIIRDGSREILAK